MSNHLPINPGEHISQVSSTLHSTDGYFLHEGNEFTDIVASKNDTERVLEGLIEARRLFDELEGKYQIRHAGFMPVVTKTSMGRVGELIVSRRVHGEPCQDPVHGIPAHQQKAAGVLFHKLNRYLEDKHRTQEPMLTDIFNLRQYVYQPDEDEMICVDTDPYFTNEAGPTVVHDAIEGLAKAVLDSESFAAWSSRMNEIVKESVDAAVNLQSEF